MIKKREDEIEYEENLEETATDIVSLMYCLKKKDPKEFDELYPRDSAVIECLSLFAAGHDTTTITTSILLYHLAHYPEIQTKVLFVIN
jgi:cytochrome P450